MWILSLYLHANKKSDDDDDDDDDDEYFLMYPNRKSVTYIKGTQHLGKTKKNVRPALTCHTNLDISPDINPALLLTGSFVRLMAKADPINKFIVHKSRGLPSLLLTD